MIEARSNSLRLIKCFKSPKIVSNVFLFPIYLLCFHYTDFVSNLRFCFQCPMYHSNFYTFFPSWSYVSKWQCFQIVSKLCMFPIYMEPYFRFGCFGFGWGLVMCIGVVKVCVNRSYYWRYCFWKFQLQKWRNSNDHQSVEQKVEVVDIEFLVCLLKPKIDHFSSFHPDTF